MSEANSLREEIADLEAYIEGLPEDVAKSAYAEPYRARLALLRMGWGAGTHAPLTKEGEEYLDALFSGDDARAWVPK